MRKLRIPWLASSKAAANPLDPLKLWLLDQERQVRHVARRREQDYLRMILRDVVEAWFNCVEYFHWELTLMRSSRVGESDDAP